jgi:phage gpG-like protein
MKFVIPQSEIKKMASDLRLSHEQGMRVGQALAKQVEARFDSKGTSGGANWPERWKKSSVSRPILQHTGTLKNSFRKNIQVEGAGTPVTKISIHSDARYAAAQHFGVPEIRGNPVLYIPITVRGEAARGGGRAKIGRLKDGQLEVFRPSPHGDSTQKGVKGRWSPGTPDAIFLAKVSLPARPMLPDSPNEQREQIDAINKEISNG